MTRHEKELMERIEELENDIEALNEELGQAYEEIESLDNELAENYIDETNTILDLTNFKRQLEIQNLINPQLDEFIENYMRFSNQGV